MENSELLKHAIAFEFLPALAVEGDYELDLWTVTVERRNAGKYAVKHAHNCWNGEGWEHEPSSSYRDEEFLSRCRFTLDEAVDIAVRLVDTVSIMGMTYEQKLLRQRGMVRKVQNP